MMLTQVLSFYCLSNPYTNTFISDTRFVLLVIATVLVAAGGYIINDYMDVKLDLVNKPLKVVVGQKISRRKTMLLHLLVNLFAIVCAWQVGKSVLLSVCLAAFFLWMYSAHFKRTFLWGNLLIALLSAFVVSINFVFDQSLNGVLVAAYSLFAFSTTLIREIIKDTEDMRGDSKFKCTTIPIVLGVRKTKTILTTLSIGLLITLIVFVGYYPANFQFYHTTSRGGLLMHMLLLVFIPILVLIYLIVVADTQSDFKRLSWVSKLIMLTGILSMCWWRI
ncbi:MAG: geranylgeranylglycerol-phosphate geranylgeranyltransferase [Bacteroidia bacterium]|jgi:4-hydroxybenzoate polyprenyltransferase|nr:geranylgeranylglycerol-phosphate geranylgeranyltransferase [Bacteroidia bacterium]